MPKFNSIEVDGQTYQVREVRTVQLHVLIDNVWKKMNVEYTEELVNDLKLIQGLNAEQELENVLRTELEAEIRQHVTQ